VTSDDLGILAYGDSAGCACKADIGLLDDLRHLPLFQSALDNQLGLFDAGSTTLPDGSRIAATVDFIGPVSRDAYDYGYIAAAHALSDLFAVGAAPMCALALAVWPRQPEARKHLERALDGIHAALKDVGIGILGGHTAHSEQPLLGICAFGQMSAPAASQITDGDLVCLTKPLGIGVAIGAMRENSCPTELEEAALQVMRTMNSIGCRLALHPSVKLVSDITGYGLGGQALRLAEHASCSVVLEGGQLPALPHVRDLIARGTGSSAAEKNWGFLKSKISGGAWPDVVLTTDPQTNGSLLVVVDGAVDPTTDLPEFGLIPVGRVAQVQASPVVLR
jgi:selenide,water dikinase